jgi:two-component system response regulator PilR (NtrC family)
MITAFASMEQAIEAIKLGAFHYITKPFKVDEIRHVIRTSIERRELEEENINLKRALGQRYSFDNLIGGSPQMLAIYDMIKRIAPTKTNVLIMGESGTGKELAAKAIHFNSPRKDGAFVTINCGAIPENLIESELFGHKKGSFTGAVSDSIGLFASADGGSLFLDEVGDLPLLTQVKVLRAIQERRFFPIGSTSAIEIDVRIISATNKDLDHEVAVNQFREDLFYRLNVISLRMPPLRDHPQDIHMLAEHFFEKHLGEQEKSIHGISQEALDVLARYNYPGNVRELENVIERAIALEQTGVILVESLPGKVVGASLAAPLIGTGFKMPPEGTDMNKILDELERDLMIQALEHSGGVKKKAAKLLNITFRSLRYRLEKHGLDSEAEDLPGQ